MQIDALVEARAADLDQAAVGVVAGALRVEQHQSVRQTSGVARFRQHVSGRGGLRGLRQGGHLLREPRLGVQRPLDLRAGSQQRIAEVGQGLPEDGVSEIDAGGDPPALEERLHEGRADAPDPEAGVGQIGELVGAGAGAAGQRDARVEATPGLCQAPIGGRQGSLRGHQVGAAREQIGRQAGGGTAGGAGRSPARIDPEG